MRKKEEIVNLNPTLKDKMKNWYAKSQTRFLTTFDMVAGFTVAVVGAFDWSPLLSIDFHSGLDWKQVTFLGSIMVVRGLAGELARGHKD